MGGNFEVVRPEIDRSGFELIRPHDVLTPFLSPQAVGFFQTTTFPIDASISQELAVFPTLLPGTTEGGAVLQHVLSARVATAAFLVTYVQLVTR